MKTSDEQRAPPVHIQTRRALQLGVASKVTTLEKTHFTEVERIGILLKNRRTSAAASAAASLAGVKGPDDLPLRPEVRSIQAKCISSLFTSKNCKRIFRQKIILKYLPGMSWFGTLK